MIDQRIQRRTREKNTMEFISGQEVKVKETVSHGVESKMFSLRARMIVDMFCAHFTINQSWGIRVSF